MGVHLPSDTLSNADVAHLVDPKRLLDFVRSNSWCRQRIGESSTDALDLAREVYASFLETRVGIRSRHVIHRPLPVRGVTPNGTHASTLGIEAARRALAAAGADGRDVDVVLCGTSTPDSLCPCTAVRIQRAIGADRGFAFDLMAACTSFVYAITVADAFLRSGAARRVLVVSAEFFSAMADWSDPESAYFAGDGAAAVVLEAAEPGEERPGLSIVDAVCRSSHSEAIRTGMGGTRQMLASRANGAAPACAGEESFPYFHQEGPQVYRDVLPQVEEVACSLLRRADLAPEDVARWWVHQASLPMIDGIFARLLGRRPSPSSLPLPLETTGNMSSCGAAYSLATDRPLSPGEYGVLLAFGGGYTVGAALLRAG